MNKIITDKFLIGIDKFCDFIEEDLVENYFSRSKD